jgi:mono/diheme cytochrome c family protein
MNAIYMSAMKRIASSRRARLTYVTGVILLLSGAWAALGQAPDGLTRSVLSGVFTEAQSKRGEEYYRQDCARCHSETLAGGESSPALAGTAFIGRWDGSTVGDLFELIRTSMPTDNPGGLNRQRYSDILAYILSVNKFPAGAKELERETAPLRQIRFEHK